MARVYLSIASEFARPYDEGGPFYDEIVRSLREAGHQLVNAWGCQDALSTAGIDLSRRLEAIAQAELVLLLVGCVYSRDVGLETQLVEEEYRAAREQGKRCVAVLAAEPAPPGFGAMLVARAAMALGQSHLAEPFRAELKQTIPTVVVAAGNRSEVIQGIHEALEAAKGGAPERVVARAAGPPRPLSAPSPGPAAAGEEATAERAGDFFVSYNKSDEGWAEWIAWQLEEEGYTTILQAWDFVGGSNWVHEMDHATRSARRTIAVLSPDYLRAQYTEPEWAAAFALDPKGRERRLVGVRVRDCDPKGLLAQVTYVDLVGRDSNDARARLLAMLRERAKPTEEPSFPGGAPHERAIKPSFPGLAGAPPVATAEPSAPVEPSASVEPSAPVVQKAGWRSYRWQGQLRVDAEMALLLGQRALATLPGARNVRRKRSKLTVEVHSDAIHSEKVELEVQPHGAGALLVLTSTNVQFEPGDWRGRNERNIRHVIALLHHLGAFGKQETDS